SSGSGVLLPREHMSTATVARASGEMLARDFEDIFREHYQLVYRSAYSVTGSHQDAEDVLQTIFLRLIKRKYPPDLLKNPKAYLYRAAVNLALNTIRSRQTSAARGRRGVS